MQHSNEIQICMHKIFIPINTNSKIKYPHSHFGRRENGHSHHTSLRRRPPAVRLQNPVPKRFLREIEPGGVGEAGSLNLQLLQG